MLALLLLLSTPGAPKRQTPLPEVRHVTAIGEAEVKVKPDQAVIRLQLVQRSVSAPTAEAAHRRQVQQFTELLREAGVEEDRLQIGHPVTAELPEVVNGLSWATTSEIRVTQRDLTKVEGILALAQAEGATLLRVTYGLTAPESQVQKALDAALASARSRAQTIAAGTGGTLGAPVTVEMLDTPEVEADSPDSALLKLSVKATFPM